ncbi:hypothetical protein BOX15_Mlig016833g3, partial [Macrostomum lignano]|uniref:SAM_MT_RSMB_NOP domain-containing protein n=2 Tax=Macrostomum lignano TaxID=282301 RepID=A0A1I8HTP6_9PLAT
RRLDYRQAGRLLELVATGRSGLKSALYKAATGSPSTAGANNSRRRMLCALVCRALRSLNQLESALINAGVLDAATGRPVVADGSLPASRFECLVQACDLLLRPATSSHRPPGVHPHLAERLRGVRLDSNTTDSSQTQPHQMPRYARINRLLAQPAEVRARLSADGFVAIDDAEGGDVDSLRPGTYLAADAHIPDLLTFPEADSARLAVHPLVTGGALCLVDKASCLPPVCLQPPPGAWVLDTCAAPGNKTLQLAAMVGPAGRVLAVDRDAQRFGELRRRLVAMGAGDRVRCLRCDCLQLGDRLSQRCRDRITHILVDPSCSGSGLTARSVERQALDGGAGAGASDAESAAAKEQQRLASLANFQAMVLRSALTDYPSARRVVYSTCSVHSEENEAVVQELANSFADKGWRLARLMKSSWPTRGLSAFDCGPMCLRAGPGTDRTCGFFVACFKRDPGGSGAAARTAAFGMRKSSGRRRNRKR